MPIPKRKLKIEFKLMNLSPRDSLHVKRNKQNHFTVLEEIFDDLARLQDAVWRTEKTEVLLRPLPESFSCISKVASANNVS